MFHKLLSITILAITITTFLSTPVDVVACNKSIAIDSTTPLSSIFVQSETTYVIKGQVDLNGGHFVVPSGCVISFKKGALVNGTITGSSTVIKRPRNQSIGVVLKGTWVCETINDAYFISSFLSDDSIIANINVLQSDEVMNNVFINKPFYDCSIPRNDGCLLFLTSNTNMVINSTISIKGNDFTSYNIIRIKGKKNISVSGGVLKGDVGKHTYVANNSSQWGHGINIYNSKNIAISDVLISYCIGDGIAISGGKSKHIGDFGLASKNIRISGVKCYFNRRQGVSIIYADGVSIIDSDFSDTGMIESHSPSAGIDIEPNSGAPYHQAVRNVLISNCTFNRNVGYSILSNHYENFSEVESVEDVLFSNCKCDSRVVLYTGGICFEGSEMKQVSLLAQKDSIIGLSFKGCKITGGNGVQFYCPSNGIDNSTKIGDILFEDCDISVASDIDVNEQKGLFWCRGRVNRIRNVFLKNCLIQIPESVPSKFELFVMEPEGIMLDNCHVNIPKHRFPRNRIRYSNCKIVSKDLIQ